MRTFFFFEMFWLWLMSMCLAWSKSPTKNSRALFRDVYSRVQKSRMKTGESPERSAGRSRFPEEQPVRRDDPFLASLRDLTIVYTTDNDSTSEGHIRGEGDRQNQILFF